MTSPLSALGREFLVQRLVSDATKTSSSTNSSHSDGDDPHSDSSSDPDLSEARPTNSTMNFGGAFIPNPLQYVAGLAHLAQMQNLMQPSANTLPFLYPHLYQSLLTFPDLDKLRLALQSPGKSPGGPSPKGEAEASPSPRKRPISQPKSGAKPLDDLNGSPTKKARAIKKIAFDEETSSPVSGMFIRAAQDVPPPEELQADALDESAKFVEVTEEAKAELEKIVNIIGDYICRLCRVKYEDAFKLAQHKCPRIIHEEYRCPECDKVFSCPANLASHRRWHKPKEKTDNKEKSVSPDSGLDEATLNKTKYQCKICDEEFESHFLLRTHALSHKNFLPKTFGSLDLSADSIRCPEAHCKEWLGSSEELEKHRRLVHPKFHCKFCTETFTTSPSLTRHINKHHPTSDCRVVLLENLS